MALLGERAGDPLHTHREKIEISLVFTEILRFQVLPVMPVTRECPVYFWVG